ncbi:hypothetical protein CWC18_00930 [Pseudoalteromonas aurantia]|uniref:hypothetical protein n=1 Tax=Pseudoalteromonas aurantia TaxID=43654 RepID=UPI00110AF437|nr:hypothetical protein [Pseudoalteromonas aurantia]TMO67247.1 hypothetical protein CWC18_00930 [Pseudoalteromonas aurantia]
MALTDWETQQNQGGFNSDGSFSNGSISLLPWPEFTVNGGIYDIDSTGIANPYEAGSFFNVSGNNLGRFINKYNRLGEIEWTYDCKRLFTSHTDADIYHFYDDGAKKWLLGVIQTDHYRKLFKLSIDGNESMISDDYLQRDGSFKSFITLENNSLYFTISLPSSGSGVTYETNISTLKRGSQIYGLGYDNNRQYGVSLFNGSVIMFNNSLCSSPGGYSNDVVVTKFALNRDLSTSGASLHKSYVKTKHLLCLNSFGGLSQLSKNVFYHQGIDTSYVGYTSALAPYHARFFTRSELEGWVSNSIFATTGFRL